MTESTTINVGSYKVTVILDEDQDLTLWIDSKYGMKVWQDEYWPEETHERSVGLRVHASGQCTRCKARVFYDEDLFLRTYDGEYTCESIPWDGDSKDRPAHTLVREETA